MTADPDSRPAKIEWAPCSCGHASCKRQHPTNLGMFYQGSGFEPHEVEWLNAAWAAMAEQPSLNAAHHNALKAAETFYDAASVEETQWTGWGDQIVPFGAEMRRVKAKQALTALRDADPRRAAGAG